MNFFILSTLLLCWENLESFKNNAVSLEKVTLDYKYNHFTPIRTPSKKILFIDIDDQSLSQLGESLGPWPWSRDIIANTISYFQKDNPKIILLDLVLSENDKSAPEKDRTLAELVKQYSNISLAINFENYEITKKQRQPASQVPFSINIDHYKLTNSSRYQSFSKPFTELWESANLIHAINFSKDGDGLYRFLPLFFEYQGQIFPALTLQAVSNTLEKPRFLLNKNNLEIYDNEILKHNIRLDENLNFQLHYYENKNDFEKIPFHNLYQSIIDKKDTKHFFKDKIIILGSSASVLQDLKPTPVEKDYPGALLHGTAISNILTEDYLIYTPSYFKFLISLFFILLIYLTFTLSSNIFIKNTMPLIYMAFYTFLSFYLFKNYEIQTPLATPLLFGFLSYGDGLAYLTMVEARQRKKIMGTLTKYLSPQISDQLLEQGIDPTAEVGYKKELSILFSDVRDFASISETIKPEQVVAMLNFYLAKMTEIVFINKGTLDKFIGDSIMSFWGAPVEDQQHAFHCVLTGLTMKYRLIEINKYFSQNFNMSFQIGIGINTGEVIVGNIGSDQRLDYTVIGDNVNLASRLEGLTKKYGLEIIIGERTFQLVQSKILCRPVDLVQVKGKKVIIQIYEPLCLKSKASKRDFDLVDRYSTALELYRIGNFQEALKMFSSLDQDFNDNPSRIMKDRCLILLAKNTDDWTGIFKFTSK
ncbi:MAG: CHASE2 domain-containing protein [Bdellovibrionaceae bacterium]|nr:CHASE2 domain-containing protein [Pseudobdellovibrionaceae bacterium]